jgi:hypothetical protein
MVIVLYGLPSLVPFCRSWPRMVRAFVSFYCSEGKCRPAAAGVAAAELIGSG